MKKFYVLIAIAALVVLASVPAFAQAPLQSAATGTDVALNANMAESLTVTLDQTAVNFTLAPNTVSNGDKVVNATVAWSLAPTRTKVALYAYFSSATAALSNGTLLIPSSNVTAKVAGATAAPFTAVTSTFGAASGLTVYTQAISAGSLIGSKTTIVDMSIDTNGLVLGAGLYTGTLHFRAEATV